MALFRFHRGGLKESLETTIIVKNLTDVTSAISKDLAPFNIKCDIAVKCTPYPNNEDCFDDRIGWYTQIVQVRYRHANKNLDYVAGYLSEPIDA